MAEARSAPGFDLCGLLRRIRRRADLSQRQLAAELGVSKSTVGAVEAGATGMDARLLAVAAGVAGLRLGLVDPDGREIPGMDGGAVRDQGGRRFPAHLDTMLSEQRWWRWADRRDRVQPTYTFDRRRNGEDGEDGEDGRNCAVGRPDDHQLPQPGDSPEERTAARRREHRRRAEEERARLVAAGRERRRAAGLPFFDDGWTCTCPPACDELDDRSGAPVHAPGCPCRCDLS